MTGANHNSQKAGDSSGPESSELMSAMGKNKSALKTIIGIGIPVTFSVLLMIWVVRDLEDPSRVWESFLGAAFLPLLAVIPLDLASHFLRALRWRRFIGGRVSIYYSFSSLMIGYAINGLVPRGGEIARVVNMNRMTGVPVAQLLATLVAERLLDLLSLLALIGMSVFLEGEYLAGKFPALSQIAPWGLGIVSVGFASLFVLAFAPEFVGNILGRIAGVIHSKLKERVEKLVQQGARGLIFMRSPRQMAMVLVETVAIWGLLWLAFVCALHAFDLFDVVRMKGSVVTFSITSASVLVPSAGAIGAFHKLGQDALVLLYQSDAACTLAFVSVLHLIAYYVVPCGGGVLLWFGQVALRGRSDSN
jgi:glycosyltransferase 2 family protein